MNSLTCFDPGPVDGFIVGDAVGNPRKRKSVRQRSLNDDVPSASCITEIASNSFDIQQPSIALFNHAPLESNVLPVSNVCFYCGAKKFHRESKGFCCADGQVRLKSHDPPIDLRDLFTSDYEESYDFLKYIRSYNSNFSMTSFGVHYDKSLFEDYNGIYTFRIQGQVYHFINEVVARSSKPSHLQLYFYDTDNEVQNRLQFGNRLGEETLSKLINILDVNPYVKFFRSLSAYANLKDHSIVIRSDPDIDQRRNNVPIVSQVAAICVEDNDAAEIFSRDIIVQCFDGTSKKVQHYFGCYDPLQYPLLFPYGESGWHRGIQLVDKKNRVNLFCQNHDVMDAENFISTENLIDAETIGCSNKRGRANVSCRDYYCYKLQMRPLENSILLHAGRLLQQYVVDMYVKIETSRLDYFRQNQTVLRAELYQGIVDSVNVGETRGKKIGRRIVLPRTFIGSPRDLQMRYMDAMSVVQKYGKPDIFLTVTCNPNWPEIAEQLEHNNESQNRPDLTVRVFRAKMELLKEDILKKQVFGPVAAHIYVIEFQKRGLPHAHFLIILKKEAKIRTACQVDTIVSAEIPSYTTYPFLNTLVRKHMMHGPCGHLNPKNVCMKGQNKCKFHFPKLFNDNTVIGNNSYPTYKRSDNGICVKVRKQILNNKWVVPYNPYLLAKYNCHINVEVCSSVEAVKYIYKYIYKGHDKISFSVDDANDDNVYDEIKMYQSARWVSPPEAMWRIYAFPLYGMSPSVITLQLHLENEHCIGYKEFDDLERIVQTDYYKQTMLTQYFRMNTTIGLARTLFYKNFPEHFVWDTKSKCWYARKKKLPVIGRIVHVSINEGERYYLRKLLNHIKGAKSYVDLRRYNGIAVASFREAALLNGLLNGDTDCYLCMEEACHYQMPSALRQLFATILALCDPHNPKKLWNSFKKHMCEDLVYMNVPLYLAEARAQRDIDEKLQCYGKSITNFLFFQCGILDEMTGTMPKIISDELNVTSTDSDRSNHQKLNERQKFAYNVILEKVMANKSGVFFIDGPGGTGKTFLYKTLLAFVREIGLIGLATASSGVAAALLPRGRTAHNRFKIPISVTNETSCVISKQSSLADLCRSARLIIWDEAPMVNKSVVECLDRMLQDICESNLPFGGKVMVLGGDFRQVLPIIRKGGKSDILNATLINSYLWDNIEKIKLTENMRAKFDDSFCEYLLRIGNGTEPLHTCGMIKLPDEFIIPYVNDVDSVYDLIDAVFPDLQNYVDDVNTMITRVILSPKNEHVDFINTMLLEQFRGLPVKYYSFDEPLDNDDISFNEDFLSSFTPNGVPPHELVLKLNCPIILLRNINPSEGLCNGTRLLCKQLNKNIIDAEIATGEYRGKRVFLPRIPFVPSDGDETPFRFKRTQFPVRPCFAMSINKAQGQTLDFVGLYLPDSVFSHGQLYVALSRAKTSLSIKVLLKPTDKRKSHSHCTKNVVFTEVLQSLNIA